MLVLVCGLPGTGKSTVARVLRERVAAEWVRTDEVRKALFEKPEYTKEEREFVYDQILKLAEIYLRQNKSVIIDATFHRRATRQKFIDLSKKLGVKLAIVECVCSEEASRRFIKERGEKEDPSRRRLPRGVSNFPR